ncbi:hypothetical protein BU17DRAFT_64174 [Hysterangium stoloniferum]|nr:hypothetical protein BU17DRAFT_64174 [Hysterangium stoloniferum]
MDRGRERGKSTPRRLWSGREQLKNQDSFRRICAVGCSASVAKHHRTSHNLMQTHLSLGSGKSIKRRLHASAGTVKKLSSKSSGMVNRMTSHEVVIRTMFNLVSVWKEVVEELLAGCMLWGGADMPVGPDDIVVTNNVTVFERPRLLPYSTASYINHRANIEPSRQVPSGMVNRMISYKVSVWKDVVEESLAWCMLLGGADMPVGPDDIVVTNNVTVFERPRLIVNISSSNAFDYDLNDSIMRPSSTLPDSPSPILLDKEREGGIRDCPGATMVKS